MKKKMLKLINNEITKNSLSPSKACTDGSTDICNNIDYSSCATHSVDYCIKLDRADCSNYADDQCYEDYGNECSGYGSTDYCGIDHN